MERGRERERMRRGRLKSVLHYWAEKNLSMGTMRICCSSGASVLGEVAFSMREHYLSLPF